MALYKYAYYYYDLEMFFCKQTKLGRGVTWKPKFILSPQLRHAASCWHLTALSVQMHYNYRALIAGCCLKVDIIEYVKIFRLPVAKCMLLNNVKDMTILKQRMKKILKH